MRKLLAITFVSLLLTGSVLASESLRPDNCKATQSSQARVAGKAVPQSSAPTPAPVEKKDVKVSAE